MAIFVAGFSELLSKVFDLGEQQQVNLNKVMHKQYTDLGFPPVVDDSFISRQTKWPNFRSLVIRLEDVDPKAANRIRAMADLEIFSEDSVSFSDLRICTSFLCVVKVSCKKRQVSVRLTILPLR